MHNNNIKKTKVKQVIENKTTKVEMNKVNRKQKKF